MKLITPTTPAPSRSELGTRRQRASARPTGDCWTNLKSTSEALRNSRARTGWLGCRESDWLPRRVPSSEPSSTVPSASGGPTNVLHCDVEESRSGTVASPVKAAFEALRALRPALPSIVDFGGLLPQSHRDFLSRWTPMSFVLSAGPPVSHLEQTAALLDARVLEVVGPAARFDVDDAGQCFAVESPLVHGSRRTAVVMLDARVP